MARKHLKRHHRTKHAKNKACFGCPQCQKSYQSKGNFKLHFLANKTETGTENSGSNHNWTKNEEDGKEGEEEDG